MFCKLAQAFGLRSEIRKLSETVTVANQFAKPVQLPVLATLMVVSRYMYT